MEEVKRWPDSSEVKGALEGVFVRDTSPYAVISAKSQTGIQFSPNSNTSNIVGPLAANVLMFECHQTDDAPSTLTSRDLVSRIT